MITIGVLHYKHGRGFSPLQVNRPAAEQGFEKKECEQLTPGLI